MLSQERIEELEAEVNRLNELLWGSRCVYCGETVGLEHQNQDIADEVLCKHVEECPKHPVSALKAERDELLAALEKIPRSELFRMKAADLVRMRRCESGDWCRWCDIEEIINRIKARKEDKDHGDAGYP